jgi:hypothetical protein
MGWDFPAAYPFLESSSHKLRPSFIILPNVLEGIQT